MTETVTRNCGKYKALLHYKSIN